MRCEFIYYVDDDAGPCQCKIFIYLTLIKKICVYMLHMHAHGARFALCAIARCGWNRGLGLN